MGGNVKGTVHRGGRFDQRMHLQRSGAGGIDRADGGVHVGHRLDLGQHDVRQAVAHLPGNRGDVSGKRRVVHRMHPHCHAGTGYGRLHQ